MANQIPRATDALPLLDTIDASLARVNALAELITSAAKGGKVRQASMDAAEEMIRELTEGATESAEGIFAFLKELEAKKKPGGIDHDA